MLLSTDSAFDKGADCNTKCSTATLHYCLLRPHSASIHNYCQLWNTKNRRRNITINAVLLCLFTGSARIECLVENPAIMLLCQSTRFPTCCMQN